MPLPVDLIVPWGKIVGLIPSLSSVRTSLLTLWHDICRKRAREEDEEDHVAEPPPEKIARAPRYLLASQKIRDIVAGTPIKKTVRTTGFPDSDDDGEWV